jgi:hypothetical protein
MVCPHESKWGYNGSKRLDLFANKALLPTELRPQPNYILESVSSSKIASNVLEKQQSVLQQNSNSIMTSRTTGGDISNDGGE